LFTEIFKPVQKISALGGAAETVFPQDAPQPGFRGQRFPTFLPDGKRFLFLGTGFGAVPVVSQVVTPLRPGLYVAALDSSPPRFVTSEVTGFFSLAQISKGQWYLLFTLNAQVLAKRFDPEQVALSGDAIPVAQATTFSASSDGTLVFLRPRAERGNARLLWVDANGQQLTTLVEAAGGGASSPSISPDQQRVAYTTDRNIWLIELTKGGRSRFTLDSRNPSQPGPNEMAVWSHDKSRIAYAAVSRSQIVQRLASGAGQDQILYQQESAGAWPLSWSPDERWLTIMTVGAAGTGFDVALLPTFGDRQPIAFKNTAATEKHLQFSPNGRWLAYSSDESGAEEIYVEGVPEAAGGSPSAQGRWQISTGGGAQPRWRGDGRELFFVSPDGQMMSVATESAANEFKASPPKALFGTSIRTSAAPIYQYDVTSDGRRFLIAEPPDGTRNSAIGVVLNWPALLKQQ
jgi:Tol biopolymer transport system component